MTFTAAAERHATPIAALSPSFVFHPIGDDGNNNMKKDDHTEVTCSSSAEQDDTTMDMELLTPYPAYTTTNEEIEECHQLEITLGEDWSLNLLSSSEMSLDGTTISDDDDVDDGDGTFSSLFDDDNNQAKETTTPATYVIEEDEEIRRKRNLLWKQSLKPSMFAQRAG